MYNEKVMDHFTNPRNVGEIENASGIGEVGNVTCGDIMKIYILVDDNEVITDIKFKTFGCGSAIASSSIATVMIKGRTIKDALKLTNKDVLTELGGLPAVKIHCSVLAEQALKSAVLDYANKTGKHFSELDDFDPSDDGHDDHGLTQLEF
jgi:nitrogen fixation NifU-like protein